MNTKLKIALSLAFTAVAFTASAQKSYTEGVANYTLSAAGTDVDVKVYFTPDSNAAVQQMGPTVIKFLANTKNTFVAILVDVPSFSVKKAAILTPDEIDQFAATAPQYTFTPGTETKVINGFNCKKVTAKDSKSGSTITVWITNDVTAPTNGLSKPFATIGGIPVQFVTIQQGIAMDATLKSITAEKAPAGTFGIPKGFDKISFDDLKAMRGGR